MSIKFQTYGQIRDRLATEAELEIFNILLEMTGEPALELVRKTDQYVSAVLGDWDVARIKYTPRAKWIMFPTAEAKQVKHRIESPSEIEEFGDVVARTIEIIKKYSD